MTSTNNTQTPQSFDSQTDQRLGVLKTYKLYIGGKFPRTESGRYYPLKSSTGQTLANMCQASRKDFREAVVAARAAQSGWAGATAYNRGQILYRIAEMLEGRASQFAAELVEMGAEPDQARQQVIVAIDRLVYYAGWSDKYQQLFSSVNPVASSHFNFSMPEPTGVVVIASPQGCPLTGLISNIAPAIVGGNAVVVLASERKPLCSITLAEVLHTSDLPGGVVNVLTGNAEELLPHFASHMDVNALIYCGSDTAQIETARVAAADNIKRVIIRNRTDWLSDDAQNPYLIRDTLETKTTWHPVGV